MFLENTRRYRNKGLNYRNLIQVAGKSPAQTTELLIGGQLGGVHTSTRSTKV